MNRDNMNIILKGMWIGGTMTVPGVSGGSMAMIMGVYDRLISSISSFFKEPAESMAFLLKFVLGAGIGMVLFRASSAICSPPGPMCLSGFSSWEQWPEVFP